MATIPVDAEAILSTIEQWVKLEEEWGSPVDLETEDEVTATSVKSAYSALDLRESTFDSSAIFKKIRRKVSRKLSKKSLLDYKEFLEDLKENESEELPAKPFYFIGGQILSAQSVEEICDKIDEVFKSIEMLCPATSTLRREKKTANPKVVVASTSVDVLSFDDSEKEKCDNDDIDQYIDEVFKDLNTTQATLEEEPNVDMASQ